MLKDDTTRDTPTLSLLEDIAEWYPTRSEDGDDYRLGADIRSREDRSVIAELVFLLWAEGFGIVAGAVGEKVSRHFGWAFHRGGLFTHRREWLEQELERRGFDPVTHFNNVMATAGKPRPMDKARGGIEL